MNVTLYNVSCEQNRVDKSDYLSNALALKGTLRNSTSIINPSILIDLSEVKDAVNAVTSDSVDTVDTSEVDVMVFYTRILLNHNYCYIKETNRYYFINDIITVNQHLWQINMSVDSLMSYKTEIGDLTAYVTRNENEYDDFINDERYPLENVQEVIESELVTPEGTTFTAFNSGETTRTKAFVFVSTYCSQKLELQSGDVARPDSDVLQYVDARRLAGEINYEFCMTYQDAVILHNNLALSSTIQSYIMSIIYYPFEITHIDSTVPFYYGDHQTIPEMTHTYYAITEVSNIIKNNEFVISSNYHNFLDLEPYTMYELYLPYKGWIKVDPQNILDKTLRVFYALEPSTGRSTVFITDETSDKLIYSDDCQLGVSIPVNTTNNQELEDQRLSSGISSAIGIVGSIIGMTTGNPLALTAGVMGIAKNTASFATNLATQHEQAKCSLGSGEVSQYAPQNVRLRVTRPVKTLTTEQEESNYLKLNGKPLHKTVLLSTLTGYTEVGSVHLDNIKTATTQELNDIESKLKSGVIL